MFYKNIRIQVVSLQEALTNAGAVYQLVKKVESFIE